MSTMNDTPVRMIAELNRWSRFLLVYWLKGDMYLWEENKAHRKATRA